MVGTRSKGLRENWNRFTWLSVSLFLSRVRDRRRIASLGCVRSGVESEKRDCAFSKTPFPDCTRLFPHDFLHATFKHTFTCILLITRQFFFLIVSLDFEHRDFFCIYLWIRYMASTIHEFIYSLFESRCVK